ncbi:hypothetical protein [Streptomyces sp. NBC_00566]|uniref:hypothetical protein n=1 Tax=Streptomyces sp. NBC_00566 TaxID=2975778 RepID=UPI002E8013E3|nr:hypothetical protein [Streptomyces sp. NBC_00566]WUB86700.1 hypothetical protein OG812_08885 [Streptomyces sp. NBC_00566]
MTDVLLAVDFPGRRDEARIADLRLEEAGWKVEYALTAPYSRVPDAGAQAAELAARRTGPAPRAVLAYCMAAPLAHELAALLSPPGAPVPLVLFDGEPGRPEAVRDAARTVAGQLTGGAAQALDDDADLLSDAALTGRPEEVMAAVEDRMNRLAAEVFRGDGFDETEAWAAATQVSGFYLDWIAHLTASLHTARPAWGGRVEHVRTPGHQGPRRWPGAGTTENHLVDSGRNDLLRDPRTRELALTLLGPPTT